ncbi:hypothetical protein N7520_009718 [Penicillium odoratum]|uniref:uncharacterized protein n=1 Tax=Penicillium odoratum TaxID=1167516 RepID=UPI0025479A68|nr:uncharacterized protein N7520_009718 [Penicillium odoratum]KAJ5752801.1 hypothetical protein N7520_009718 [Penicillium odoratum]
MNPGPEIEWNLRIRHPEIEKDFGNVIELTKDGLAIIPIDMAIRLRCEQKFPAQPQPWYNPAQIYIVIIEISAKNAPNSDLGRLLMSSEGALTKIALMLQEYFWVWPDLSPIDMDLVAKRRVNKCVLERIDATYCERIESKYCERTYTTYNERIKQIIDDAWTITFSFRNDFGRYSVKGDLIYLSSVFLPREV